jgi:outer membrane lipoprotein-sorting protein
VVAQKRVAVVGFAFVAAAVIAPGRAETITDTNVLLDRAREAARKVKTVQYDFVRQGIHADEGRSPRLEGTASYGGWRQLWVEKFRVDARMTRPGQTEATEVVAGSDGNVVYLVDSKNKKVYADMDPAVLGAMARPVRQCLMMYFVNPDAFEDEKKAESKEIKGIVKVGNEDCYELRVGRGENSDSTWYLSVKDLLPRRLDLTFQNREGQKAGYSMVLSNLKVNVEGSKDPFQLVVPEGYAKTDDFAP